MPRLIAMQLVGNKQTANSMSSQLLSTTLHQLSCVRDRWLIQWWGVCVVTGSSDDEYVARPQAGGSQSSDTSSTLHSLLDSVINK